MPNGLIEIEEFERLDNVDIKLNILFKTLTVYTSKIDARFEAGSKRFEKLENRKLIDSAYATAGGFVGGALAMLGLKWKGIG